MSEHTYKKVEIVGTSKTGTDDAIKNAIEKSERLTEKSGIGSK